MPRPKSGIRMTAGERYYTGVDIQKHESISEKQRRLSSPVVSYTASKDTIEKILARHGL